MRNKPITKRVTYTTGFCDVYDVQHQTTELSVPFKLEGRVKDPVQACKKLSTAEHLVFTVAISAFEEQNYTLGEAEFLKNGEVISFEKTDDLG